MILASCLRALAIVTTGIVMSSATPARPADPALVLPPAPWVEDDPADTLYRNARRAMSDGDFVRAARLFGDITTRYPRSAYAADAYYYRGYSLYRVGGEANLREALDAITTQKRRFPKAATIGDAGELAVRIRGLLAQRGDAKAAEDVATTANVRCERGNGERDDIRSEAMNALLQMDAQSAVPIIREVLQKRDACSASLRKRAVFLLSQKPSSETVSLLVATTRTDPSQEVRQEAVFWLGQVRSDQATTALEEIATRHADVEMRKRAIFALGQQGASRGMALLRSIAESPGPFEIRHDAIWQLGQRRAQENADFLRALFGRLRGNEDLQKHTLFSLSQMRGFGNDRWLLGVSLDESQPHDVRKHAIWTAGQAGLPGSELVPLYDRMTDRDMKEQLIWVMSESRDRTASDKLVEIARRDRDPEMRKKAIFWLGQKNDPRIRQILLEILSNG